MAYEMLVAMNVTDTTRYAQYREAMKPLLAEYGGGFRYDFEVSETFSEAPAHDVTRVFAIYFSDGAASGSFFADPRYLEVKREHYEGAVDGHTVIAAYDR